MLLVGLTGGIGCGKTTVLQEFQRLGIPCFIADDCAKSYYNDLSFCLTIGDNFGKDVLQPDGYVDKARLAQKVFSDLQALLLLNSMIHPRVMDDFSRWASNQYAPIVIFESAIIYEYHLEKYLDCVVAVYLEREERLRRLQIRDHTSRQQLEARMRNQLSAEEIMQRSDFVVLNYEGNPRTRQVKTILGKLESIALNKK